MAIDPRARLAGQLGAATRWKRPDAAELRADLAEANIRAFIERTVDAAPPLGPARRARLAALLGGTAPAVEGAKPGDQGGTKSLAPTPAAARGGAA